MARSLPFRTRNAEATRADLLEAAQEVFARKSYAQAGMREIAAKAGTSPALAIRYFGSKAGLYEAALQEAMRLPPDLTQDRGTFGARLAAELLNPAHEIRPPLIMALASGDAQACAIAEKMMFEVAICALSGWLGGERGRERTMAIAMLATGFALYLRQFDWPALSPSERARLSGWFAREVQALVDAPMLP